MKKNRRKASACPNCNSVLNAEDNFCKNCGQENHDLNVPFHHLVGEFIESIFHIDTKVLQTLKVIFTRPGQITKDFVEGKRARYMPPARLYIFVSFVFFLLVNIAADRSLKQLGSGAIIKNSNFDFTIAGRSVKINKETADEALRLNDAQIDSVLLKNKIEVSATNRALYKKVNANYEDMLKSFLGQGTKVLVGDSASDGFEMYEKSVLENLSEKELKTIFAQKNLRVSDEDITDLKDQLKNKKTGLLSKSSVNGISNKILKTMPPHATSVQIDSVLSVNKIKPDWNKRLGVRIFQRFADFDFDEDSQTLSHKIFKNLSWVMFILMPVVAILLLLLYFKTKKNYYEYFIFSIHIHSILFLIMSIEMGLRLVFHTKNLFPFISLIIVYIYFLLSLKKFFGQSWPKTVFKFVMLNLTYGIVFILFLAFTLFYSFATF